MLAIKTILHPTDFSEPSRVALDMACGLASDYGAQLVIIHVMATPLLAPATKVAGIQSKLDGLEIPTNGIDVVRRIEEGNPAAEILRMGQICNADLIVMGSHGRGAMERWLMGSVAESVMRAATCPVLTVTAPQLAATTLPAGAEGMEAAPAQEPVALAVRSVPSQ
ncbi:MAG: universal stress protein [Chthoniobacterales bacterium]